MTLAMLLPLGVFAVGCDLPTGAQRAGTEETTPALGQDGANRGGGEGVFGAGADRDDPDRERARAAWDRARNAPLVARVVGTENHEDLWGVVRLREVGGQVHVEANVDGLPEGQHGFHVHQYGDCSAPEQESMGAHAQFEALAGVAGERQMGTPRNAPSMEPNVPTGMRPGVVPGQPAAPDGVGAQSPGAGGGATPSGTAAANPTPGMGADEQVAADGATTPSPHVHGNLGELDGGEQTTSVTHLVPNLSVEDLPALVGLAVVIHERGNEDPNDPTGNAGAPIACGVLGVAKAAAPVVPVDQQAPAGEAPATPPTAPAAPPRPANEG